MSEIIIKGWQSSVPGGKQTVLDASLAAGVPVSYDCRSGECGTCKCRLLDGEVKTLGHMPGVLTKAEEKDGWILACRSRARSNITIEFPAELSTDTQHPVKVDCRAGSILQVSRDVVHLTVHLDEPYQFSPGQYVKLQVPGFPDRSFSPANKPNAQTLEFYIRVWDDGLVSPILARQVSEGHRLRVEGPFGTACLHDKPTGPLLLAGGGTGIAPMLSILMQVADTAPHTECWFYAGVRSKDDVVAEQVIASAAATMPNLRVEWATSDESNNGYRSGFLGEVILQDHQDLRNFSVFIAGPPPMVENVETAVRALGVAPDAIKSDPFLPQAKPTEPQRGSFGKIRGFLRRRAS